MDGNEASGFLILGKCLRCEYNAFSCFTSGPAVQAVHLKSYLKRFDGTEKHG